MFVFYHSFVCYINHSLYLDILDVTYFSLAKKVECRRQPAEGMWHAVNELHAFVPRCFFVIPDSHCCHVYVPACYIRSLHVSNL